MTTMRNDNDILKKPELRERPYEVPEGYFTSVKEVIRTADRTTGNSRRRQNVGLYIMAAAASLALLILAGTGVLSKPETGEYYDSIDLLVFSDISEESYYDLQAMSEPEELTEDDIIEYLIYTGTTLESIESNE